MPSPLDPAALAAPIVLAPMAGGPSTPALAAAVSDAGGLGTLAAGYRAPDALADDLARTRERTSRPIGVNLFAPPPPAVPATRIAAHAAAVAREASALGVAAGAPRHDDDGWNEKIALLERDPVAVVSVTFGLPAAEVLARLRAAGSAVWVTVTSAEEARAAAAAGADALIVQGAEAGGHQGGFVDEPGREPLGVLALLQLVRAAVEVPLIAAGGIATGAGLAAVLAAGAAAAQLGTAFLGCPEAGTWAGHRALLGGDRPTAFTRAFSGRRARGLETRFAREHEDTAAVAYPQIHHLTAPVRAAARAAGDAERVSLWAGQAHPLAASRPAAELVAVLTAEADAALQAAIGCRAATAVSDLR
ncbi:nitronate monooxygenase [Patulibacter brassicae]|uniref:Propionate 3-nitronate monooxygenase n=1 Tax=Patulibacter brassicae TaxID=1705717 RepID=A0ABU4VM64_9ACTN|nr:nitronate monooxygenase [Patulibacter brassicae]MDX8152931.1 nitronate monooxygenase [Patulibacter brassicae]